MNWCVLYEMPHKPLPPGDFIREELQRRNWTQADLAMIIDRPLPAINEILQSKRALNYETAVALAAAFNTKPEYWMDLERNYRLSLVQEDPKIERRARLFQFAPIQEMQRRGWIKETEDTSHAEEELSRFFGIASLDDEPQIAMAARKTDPKSPVNSEQRAWVRRAIQMAEDLPADKFDVAALEDGLDELRKLVDVPEKLRFVPRILAARGVRLVVVEHLHRSRIDGATTWLDENRPVVAMSVRNDRIDSVWHTLFHELSHVKHEDAFSIDQDLTGQDRQRAEDKTDIERRADREAAERLIPTDAMHSFVVKEKPFFSKARIARFAAQHKVHPGIVVGQLQNQGVIGWQTNRESLVKVREFLTRNSLTDGWGTVFAITKTA